MHESVVSLRRRHRHRKRNPHARTKHTRDRGRFSDPALRVQLRSWSRSDIAVGARHRYFRSSGSLSLPRTNQRRRRLPSLSRGFPFPAAMFGTMSTSVARVALLFFCFGLFLYLASCFCFRTGEGEAGGSSELVPHRIRLHVPTDHRATSECRQEDE